MINLNVEQIINDNYELGRILKITETQFGSGHTFLIETGQSKYVAKIDCNKDEIELYYQIEKDTNTHFIRQAKIILTVDDCPITKEGLIIYEYISGVTLKVLTGDLEIEAVKLIKRFNECLQSISIKCFNFGQYSEWNKLKSLDYLCDETCTKILDLNLDPKLISEVNESINLLKTYRDRLLECDQQLIHADLGADNFIVEHSQISATIDFTPDINNEFYALAQFVYWNYLWNTQEIDLKKLNSYLEHYLERVIKPPDLEIYYMNLLYASIYRLVGYCLTLNESSKNTPALEKRMRIVRWIECMLVDT